MLAIILSALVLVVNAAVSARSDGPSIHQSELAYLDGVRPLVERSSQEGADLVDVRENAVGLGRDAVARRLERVARDAGDVLGEGRRLVAPASLREAHDLLIAALAIRAQATSSMHQALVGALGSQAPELVVGAVVDVGRDMAAADRAYQLFTVSLPKSEVVLPPSQWEKDDAAWSSPLVASFVASLRSSTMLSPVHDLAVLLVDVDPAAVGTEGPVSVIPTVKNLRLQIVVADNGNQAEHHVTVTATIAAQAPAIPPNGSPANGGPPNGVAATTTPTTAPPTAAVGGGGGTESARDFVDLAPGQRRTVTLGTLRPLPNVIFALTVRIDPAPGEASVTDNEKTLMFTMR